MMNNPLKVGIVGFGYMGQIRKNVIERNPRLTLVGIFDSNPLKIEKNGEYPLFTSLDQLLKQDIDIIFVCTPNRFSPEICIESLKRGKHVFCEKPPGCNPTDIKNIIQYETSATKLMFGFNHRFHPGIIKAKTLSDSNRLGKIIGLRGTYGKSGGLRFKESWRNNKEISGGGILLDQGIHMLDLFRYFCGDFECIKCFTTHSFWNFNVEDNAYVIMQNKDRQMASLHSSATLWKHTFRLDITFEEGYIIVDGLLSKTGSYGREKLIIGKRQFENDTHALGNPSEEITYFDRDLSWDLEVEEFVACIIENKKVSTSSSEDALKVMEMIEKAYHNAREKGAQE